MANGKNTIVFQPEEIANMNINTARDLLFDASMEGDEGKIKNLVMAYRYIEGTLKVLGVDVDEIKIKKEK